MVCISWIVGEKNILNLDRIWNHIGLNRMNFWTYKAEIPKIFILH